MNKTHLFLTTNLLLLAITFSTPCIGQSDSKTKVDKIHALVNTFAEYGKFNGTVLVAQEGKVLYKKGLGFANMEWDIPNQTDTKFRLASVSKQFTAMLVMQLVAKNKLALDLPISTYLPNYPKENGDKISIHQLLSHTSGLFNYTELPNYREFMRTSMQPTQLIDIFKDSTLKFTPGERFSYSNSGYVLLGLIMEKVTGKTYETLLQEQILGPLQMKNTGFDNNKTILKNKANGYNKNGLSFVTSSFIDMSIAYTAGGLYSTVEDLYLWDQALYTEKLLPKKYLDLMFEQHIPAWGKHYGYGWLTGDLSIGNTKEKIKTIQHDGFMNGFNTLILRIPSSRSSILLLNNTGGAPLYQMSEAICGILYDKPYDFPKKSIAYSFLDLIEKEGITKGIEYFKNTKADKDHYLDEHELNRVSYHFLQANKKKLALEVLQLALSAFPQSFNLYDSYGEVLRASGNKEAAIANYKKSVLLNPANKNGLKMLKELGVDLHPEDLYLLKTGKDWGKEIFTFPLHFAEDIHYVGTEEACFPRGWSNPDSPEFWSYTFAWNINSTTELTDAELKHNLEVYFDGLMAGVNKNKGLVLPKTVIKLDKKKSKHSKVTTGRIELFDAFIKNEVFTLQVSFQIQHCKEKNKSIIVFKFSPQEFGTEMWSTLDQIKLRANVCED